MLLVAGLRPLWTSLPGVLDWLYRRCQTTRERYKVFIFQYFKIFWMPSTTWQHMDYSKEKFNKLYYTPLHYSDTYTQKHIHIQLVPNCHHKKIDKKANWKLLNSTNSIKDLFKTNDWIQIFFEDTWLPLIVLT